MGPWLKNDVLTFVRVESFWKLLQKCCLTVSPQCFPQSPQRKETKTTWHGSKRRKPWILMIDHWHNLISCSCWIAGWMNQDGFAAEMKSPFKIRNHSSMDQEMTVEPQRHGIHCMVGGRGRTIFNKASFYILPTFYMSLHQIWYTSLVSCYPSRLENAL